MGKLSNVLVWCFNFAKGRVQVAEARKKLVEKGWVRLVELLQTEYLKDLINI